MTVVVKQSKLLGRFDPCFCAATSVKTYDRASTACHSTAKAMQWQQHVDDIGSYIYILSLESRFLTQRQS